MNNERPTVQEMQNWDKRYKISKEDTKKVIDTVDEGEYWTVHPNEAYNLCIDLNNLIDENDQLRQELQIYHKVAYCGNCHYHDYDWDVDDGYGGDEYEVCNKGNDVSEGICEDWREL